MKVAFTVSPGGWAIADDPAHIRAQTETIGEELNTECCAH